MLNFHEATHIYTPFTDAAIIQTLSASKLETMDRRNHHLYALVLAQSAERSVITEGVVFEKSRGEKGGTSHGFGLMRALDSFDTYNMYIYIY